MSNTLEQHPANTGRHAGILLPLFSMRSDTDWGIGDFGALSSWIEWTAAHKTRILQILPINEMPPGQECPYTALSAFALDPMFISVELVEDVRHSPAAREYLASPEAQDSIAKWRKSDTVLYGPIKDLKYRVLWMAFQHFHKNDIAKGSARAMSFRKYREEQAYWLNDYSTFRTMKDVDGWKSWTHWPEPLRNHESAAIDKFRREHATQVLFFEYLQWLADLQWHQAKKKARELGVWMFGDLPFMVNQESADVWGHQDIFDISREIGAPPDQFSTEGQRWGLPAYRWQKLEESGFAWWKTRVGRAVEIYDLFRLDHLVGFFRTWVIPHEKGSKPHFDTLGDVNQQQRGERFLRAVISASGGALPVAEDLGLIPPFVRHTLDDLRIPGYKVMRWEMIGDGPRYKGPEDYPTVSLATTSTHDTETLRQWWDELKPESRDMFWEMVTGEKNRHPRWSERVQVETIKRLLYSRSSIVLFPLQDVLGTAERINTPGTVGPHNWTWRFALTPEKLNASTKYKDVLHTWKCLVAESGRGLRK